MFYRIRRECRLWGRSEAHAAEVRIHVLEAVGPPPGIDGIPGMTAFDWCVAKGESGDGANLSNGTDFGWFQFLPSTYDTVLGYMAADGIDTSSWDRSPLTAPVWQQVAAFNYYEPKNPGAWPNTVGPCL